MKYRHIIPCLLTFSAFSACSADDQRPSVPGETQTATVSAAIEPPCTAPNMTLSLDGIGSRRFCDGYAAVMMHSLYITGKNDDDILSVVFSPGNKDSIPVGQYQATQWKKPKGQRYQVMAVFTDQLGSGQHEGYSIANGTVDLLISDGERFKGTFSGESKHIKNSKEVRKMSGTFDVRFDASKNIRDFDAVDSIVKAESHGKVDLMDTIRHSLKESGLPVK